jgi:dolichol kinase
MADPDAHPSPAGFSLQDELKRKSIHLSLFIVPLGYYLAPRPLGMLGLILATSMIVSMDILRLRSAFFGRIFLRVFGPLIRSHERTHILGSTYYMAAVFTCVMVFDRQVALSALLFLVLGDTAAAVVGRKFGRKFYREKSLEGSLACFLCCVFIGLLLLNSLWVMISGALTATLVEAVPLRINDNLKVPILSGLVMQVVASNLQG